MFPPLLSSIKLKRREGILLLGVREIDETLVDIKSIRVLVVAPFKVQNVKVLLIPTKFSKSEGKVK